MTVAALIALNRPDQLRSHLVRARENGLTQAELVETITHLAFYTGWPNAVSAIAVAGKFSRRNERKAYAGEIMKTQFIALWTLAPATTGALST